MKKALGKKRIKFVIISRTRKYWVFQILILILDAIQKKNLPTAVFESSPGMKYAKRGQFQLWLNLINIVSIFSETTMFNFKSKKDREQDKSCAQFCLPSCNETFYNVFVTAGWLKVKS